jgi:hypothetical protein
VAIAGGMLSASVQARTPTEIVLMARQREDGKNGDAVMASRSSRRIDV